MILVSDFDDTLAPRNNPEALQRNLEAVQDFRAQGNLFCLASGRAFSSLKRHLPNYSDYLDYIIMDNGAYCLDNHDNLIFSFDVPLELARKVDDFVKSELSKTNSPYQLVAYYDLSEHPDFSGPVTKLRFWVKDDQTALDLGQLLTKTFPELYADAALGIIVSGLPWVDSSWGAFVDVVSSDGGKEKAIEHLMTLLNYSGPVITIGDSTNDTAMLKAFDGYAVQNAVPEVLASVPSSHIVSSVAELIDRLQK